MDAQINMSNEFNIFLPDNPCRKVGLAESQYEWSTTRSTLVVIFWFGRTLAKMVHGTGRTITTDLEDYHKVTNILKERANTINMK